MKNHFAIRKKRLEQEYQKYISKAIVTDISDPRLQQAIIDITRVEINEEMTVATVYFLILREEDKNKVIKGLYSCKNFFLSLLKKKIKIGYLPNIKFFYDHREKEVNNVLDLIESLKVEHDKKGSTPLNDDSKIS